MFKRMIEHDQIKFASHFTQIPLHQRNPRGRLAIGGDEGISTSQVAESESGQPVKQQTATTADIEDSRVAVKLKLSEHGDHVSAEEDAEKTFGHGRCHQG